MLSSTVSASNDDIFKCYFIKELIKLEFYFTSASDELLV